MKRREFMGLIGAGVTSLPIIEVFSQTSSTSYSDASRVSLLEKLKKLKTYQSAIYDGEIVIGGPTPKKSYHFFVCQDKRDKNSYVGIKAPALNDGDWYDDTVEYVKVSINPGSPHANAFGREQAKKCIETIDNLLQDKKFDKAFNEVKSAVVNNYGTVWQTSEGIVIYDRANDGLSQKTQTAPGGPTLSDFVHETMLGVNRMPSENLVYGWSKSDFEELKVQLAGIINSLNDAL